MTSADTADVEEEIRTKIRPLFNKTAFLFGVLLVYLMAGAFLFQVLEYAERDESIEEATIDLEKERADLLKVVPKPLLGEILQDVVFPRIIDPT